MKCNTFSVNIHHPTAAERALYYQITKAKHQIDITRARTNYLLMRIRRALVAKRNHKAKIEEIVCFDDISNLMQKTLTLENNTKKPEDDIMKLGEMSIDDSKIKEI